MHHIVIFLRHELLFKITWLQWWMAILQLRIWCHNICRDRERTQTVSEELKRRDGSRIQQSIIPETPTGLLEYFSCRSQSSAWSSRSFSLLPLSCVHSSDQLIFFFFFQKRWGWNYKFENEINIEILFLLK